MPLLIGLAAGGALANTYSQQQAYDQKKKIAAATQRYSPWTGMKADTPVQPSMVGSAFQGGAQGAMLGQGINNAAASQQLADQQAKWLQQNPYNYGTGASAAMGTGASNPWSLGTSYSGQSNPFGLTQWQPGSY